MAPGREHEPDVTLEVATAADASILSNLIELYVHDLSEIFPVEIRADGRFGYDALPLYWSEPDRRLPFFIRSGPRLAGFALVTRGSPATADPDDLDVAEFFVLRSHRRAGVGRRAAFALWDRLRGRWVVRVSQANRAGVSFWEPTVRDYTGGAFSESEHRGKVHAFRVFTFRSADAST
jgi:predicted acetyltransferase